MLYKFVRLEKLEFDTVDLDRIYDYWETVSLVRMHKISSEHWHPGKTLRELGAVCYT